MDIDIDISPSKKPQILKKIAEQRGESFIPEIQGLPRQKFGCAMIATFTSASTKKAIQIACSGYRTPDYPDGIDSDTYQYIASLVRRERGFLWTLHDMVYGNQEKGRKTDENFIRELKKYPGLLEIMLGVEGLYVTRSSHASGVLFTDEDPYEITAFMKTPSGEIVTQFDLHDLEAVGGTKYDLLVTSAMDKIASCIELLQKDNLIDPKLSLKEVYYKYLHPDVMNFEDEKIWDSIKRNDVLDLFQFDSTEGRKGIDLIQPNNLTELSNVNGLIRLVAPENSTERPIEKYLRFKKNPQLWYDEMKSYGLSEKDVKALERYYKSSYGISISQENFLFSLGDPDICGWDFAKCNDSRRIISKKKLDKLPILKEEIIRDAGEVLGRYYWDQVVLPISTYSFSDPHSLSYAMVANQFAYLANSFNPIYWNTACLIVNSNSLETEEESNKKNKSTDFDKIARALGDILKKGIKISCTDINKSGLSFTPDAKNNQIIYGLKPLSYMNEETVKDIFSKRPFKGIKDFLERTNYKKPIVLNLIKSGAFDECEKDFNRKEVMGYYIKQLANFKTKLNLQNYQGLISEDMIPPELDFQTRVFNLNKYIKSKNRKSDVLVLDERAMNFIEKNCGEINDYIEIVNGRPQIDAKIWDKKYYQIVMDEAREWLKEHQEETLKEYNKKLFYRTWKDNADGTISKWEMDSLTFYQHEHELAHINFDKYGIVDFFSIDLSTQVEYYYTRGQMEYPIYHISRIAGTVIAKNDNKSSISLLTTTGVVNVKFDKDLYAKYKKQISQIQKDGTKKVIEKSWFTRGTKIIVQGYRTDNKEFRCKTYKNTIGHHIYLISEINGEDIVLQNERMSAEGVLEEEEYV